MVGALLDTTRADRGGAAAPVDRGGVLRRFLRPSGEPKSVTNIADHSNAADSAQTATFASDADTQTWTPPSWEEIVSTHSGQKELIPWLAKNPNVDVILTAYNFTMEPFMADVIDQAAKAGKGLVGMKVMAGGLRRMQKTDPNFAKLSRDGAMLSDLPERSWCCRFS